MGKPKLTYELIDKAVALKSDGLSNKDICAALGIHESTFYRWLEEPHTKLQRELNEQLKKAESARKRALLNTIRDAAMAKHSFWTAAAWLLERTYPDEYSQNRRTGGEAAESAPQIVLGVNVGVARGDQEMAGAGASVDGAFSPQKAEGLGGEGEGDVRQREELDG